MHDLLYASTLLDLRAEQMWTTVPSMLRDEFLVRDWLLRSESVSENDGDGYLRDVAHHLSHAAEMAWELVCPGPFHYGPFPEIASDAPAYVSTVHAMVNGALLIRTAEQTIIVGLNWHDEDEDEDGLREHGSLGLCRWVSPSHDVREHLCPNLIFHLWGHVLVRLDTATRRTPRNATPTAPSAARFNIHIDDLPPLWTREVIRGAGAPGQQRPREEPQAWLDPDF